MQRGFFCSFNLIIIWRLICNCRIRTGGGTAAGMIGTCIWALTLPRLGPFGRVVLNDRQAPDFADGIRAHGQDTVRTWSAHGQHAGSRRPARGQHTGSTRAAHGQHTDSRRSAHGQQTVSLSARGQHTAQRTVSARSAHGQRTVNTRSAHDQHAARTISDVAFRVHVARVGVERGGLLGGYRIHAAALLFLGQLLGAFVHACRVNVKK